jgi:hypothetical protein
MPSFTAGRRAERCCRAADLASRRHRCRAIVATDRHVHLVPAWVGRDRVHAFV